MRWRLNDPITKVELRRLLKRERHICAEIEKQLEIARSEKDALEQLYAVMREEVKRG